MVDYQFVIDKCISYGINQQKELLRTRKLIESWVLRELQHNKNVYFATFTFNDENLPFNRRKFVDYLSRTCKIKVVLYHDYGKKNNRFHLHGFISVSQDLDILHKDYYNKFGFTKFEYLDSFKGGIDIKRSVKYMIKYSTKFNKSRFRIIKTNPKIY